MDIRVKQTVQLDKENIKLIESLFGEPIGEALKDMAEQQLKDATDNDMEKINVEIYEADR